MRAFRKLRSAEGSLPLALIVSIVVAGLVVVLFARTITAQRQVVFDETFHGTLPVAEAGIAQALNRLNSDEPLTSATDFQPYDRAAFPVDHSTAPVTDQVDGREVTWRMTRVDGRTWELEATATDSQAELDRQVIVTASEQPVLGVAAFSDRGFEVRGGSSADSYTSQPDESGWCTGRGFVASNGFEFDHITNPTDVNFAGGGDSPKGCHADSSQRSIDRVILYNWADRNDPNATSTYPGGDRCKRQGNPSVANCREQDGFQAPLTIDEPLDVVTQDATAFIKNALDKCDSLEDGAASDPDEQAVAPDGTLRPAPNATDAAEGAWTPDAPGSYHCYQNFDFNEEHTRLHTSATPDNPVIIFVRDQVVFRRAKPPRPVIVGLDCGQATEPDCVPYQPGLTPAAGRLWIYVQAGTVAFSGDSQFAGVMWAPNSECDRSGGGPQIDIYGSILCGDVTSTAQWQFHFDDALDDFTDGQYFPQRWEERTAD